MSEFTNKIDFAVVVMVNHANPNGDPLNENRPREDYDGYGEISDVCLKRKIRNRLQDFFLEKQASGDDCDGCDIFVKSKDRADDGFKSLADRAKSNKKMQAALKAKDEDAYMKAACNKWLDVRAFGQVFSFEKNFSAGVRGPVSVHSAYSVAPIDIESKQIVRSVMGSAPNDTMGAKHSVRHALYVFKGSINHQLAEKTGFTDEDAMQIKKALQTMFVNDSSAARPDGSIDVVTVCWWEHNCKIGQYPSSRVHSLLKVSAKVDDPKTIEDYTIDVEELPGLKCDVIMGDDLFRIDES